MSSKIDLRLKTPTAEEHAVTFDENREKLVLGHDEGADLALTGLGLEKYHALFRYQRGVLTIHVLAKGQSTLLNGHTLQHGKTYILELDDHLQLGRLEGSLQDVSEEATDKGPAESFENSSETMPPPPPEPENETLDKENSDELFEDGEELFDEKTLPHVPAPPPIENKDDREDFEAPPQMPKPSPSSLPDDLETPPGIGAGEPEESEEDIEDQEERDGEEEARDESDQTSPQILPPQKEVLAGFFGRFLALTLDIGVAYTLWFGLFTFLPAIQSFLRGFLSSLATALIAPLPSSPLVTLLSKLGMEKQVESEKALLTQLEGQLFSPQNWEFFLFAGLFMCLSSLAFGVTFGNFVLFITNTGKSLTKRLKGFFRTLLGLFTLPFLLFDIPVLLGFRSFKEFVLRDQLNYRKKIFKWLSPPILFPLFLALILISPLLGGRRALMGLPVEKEKQKILLEARESNEYRPKLHTSRYLGLRFSDEIVSLFQQNHLILPYTQSQTSPESMGLQLISLKEQNEARLYLRKEKFPFHQMVKKGLQGNPLKPYFFPELTALPELPSEEQDSSTTATTGINSVNANEVVNLFSLNLSLPPLGQIPLSPNQSTKKYRDLIKHQGPFFVGPLAFNQGMKDFLSTHKWGTPEKIVWIEREQQLVSLPEDQKKQDAEKHWVSPLIEIQTNRDNYFLFTSHNQWQALTITPSKAQSHTHKLLLEGLKSALSHDRPPLSWSAPKNLPAKNELSNSFYPFMFISKAYVATQNKAFNLNLFHQMDQLYRDALGRIKDSESLYALKKLKENYQTWAEFIEAKSENRTILKGLKELQSEIDSLEKNLKTPEKSNTEEEKQKGDSPSEGK